MASAGSAARDAVQARGLGRCDRCGGQLGEDFHAHHRKLRSQGGGWNLANVAALCSHCHRDVHDRPATAVLAGWIVPSHADPREVPVHLRSGWALQPHGTLALLTDHGNWTPAYPHNTKD